MAKSRHRQTRRVTQDNARRSLPQQITLSRSPNKTNLRLYEDRRTWHPEGDYRSPRSIRSQRPKTVTRRTTRTTKTNRNNIQTADRYGATLLREVIAFRSPERVLICARREIRKRVLHALKKTGKRGQKRPRFNRFSKISCRR